MSGAPRRLPTCIYGVVIGKTRPQVVSKSLFHQRPGDSRYQRAKPHILKPYIAPGQQLVNQDKHEVNNRERTVKLTICQNTSSPGTCPNTWLAIALLVANTAVVMSDASTISATPTIMAKPISLLIKKFGIFSVFQARLTALSSASNAPDAENSRWRRPLMRGYPHCSGYSKLPLQHPKATAPTQAKYASGYRR